MKYFPDKKLEEENRGLKKDETVARKPILMIDATEDFLENYELVGSELLQIKKSYSIFPHDYPENEIECKNRVWEELGKEALRRAPYYHADLVSCSPTKRAYNTYTKRVFLDEKRIIELTAEILFYKKA